MKTEEIHIIWKRYDGLTRFSYMKGELKYLQASGKSINVIQMLEQDEAIITALSLLKAISNANPDIKGSKEAQQILSKLTLIDLDNSTDMTYIDEVNNLTGKEGS